MEWNELITELRPLLTFLAAAAGIALLLGLALMFLAIWRLRRLHIPPDADFVEAMSLTPLIVVLVLDLLDFALDFLAAPIAWAFLTRLGLRPLRGAAVIEQLIPATQFIPTMTIGWLAVRLLGPRRLRRILPS